MKQLKTIYFLLTLILLTPMATVSAEGTVNQAHIGTALDQSNQPLNIDTVFSTETEQLVIWASFNDLSGGDEIQFDLVVPGAETVYISPTKGLASSAETYTAWAVVPMQNLNLQPGNYVANVYLNGFSAKQVAIQLTGGNTPPIPYMIVNDIEAPEQVSLGEEFTLRVFTSYHFNAETQVNPTIFDPATETVIAATGDTLIDKGERGYTFTLTAPEASGEYIIYAINYFTEGGALTYNENGGIQTIVIQLTGESSNTLPKIDTTQIDQLIPDDISLQELADLIPDNLDIDLSELGLPDSIKEGLEDVEDIAKNNGVPGYPVEAIIAALVLIAVYYARRN